MKKILLSIIFLTSVSLEAHAQFILGIKGGATFSKISADNVKGSNLTGYQAGIFMRAGQGLYFQPEIYLGSSGGKFDFPLNGNASLGSDGNNVRFTTLNVPLLVGHSFGSNNLNFRIMAGPVYSANISKDKNFSQNVLNAYPGFDHYSNSVLNYQVGAGIEFGAFNLDGRYEGGLTKVNQQYNEKQSLFSVSLGFKVL